MVFAAVIAIVLGIGVIMSLALTRGLITVAERRGYHDIPNERSSHSAATPRGGGLAIVLVTVSLWVTYLAAFRIGAPELWAWVIGGAAIALFGWLDDTKALVSIVARLVAQMLAAVLVVASLWSLSGATLQMGSFALALLATLFIGWLTNLYNFMDGIDGIAGIEAITAGTFLAFLAYLSGDEALTLAFGLIAVSALGFIVYNWSPAKIFMGDVGSAFLGFAFATLGLIGVVRGSFPLTSVLLLLGVFLIDSTVTLLRRLAQGEKFWRAHRSHSYQRAVQRGHSHARVSFAVAALNVVWLGPFAILSYRFPGLGVGLTVAGLMPLLVITLYFQSDLIRRSAGVSAG